MLSSTKLYTCVIQQELKKNNKKIYIFNIHLNFTCEVSGLLDRPLNSHVMVSCHAEIKQVTSLSSKVPESINTFSLAAPTKIWHHHRPNKHKKCIPGNKESKWWSNNKTTCKYYPAGNHPHHLIFLKIILITQSLHFTHCTVSINT